MFELGDWAWEGMCDAMRCDGTGVVDMAYGVWIMGWDGMEWDKGEGENSTFARARRRCLGTDEAMVVEGWGSGQGEAVVRYEEGDRGKLEKSRACVERS